MPKDPTPAPDTPSVAEVPPTPAPASGPCDAGLVAFLSVPPMGRYYAADPDTGVLHLAWLVQDDPESVENGDGHYEWYDGADEDYLPHKPAVPPAPTDPTV